uniref:Uncharacterized protein n=1 Tax=Anguilla anguilla TaxID=7936 RepID=A0A0E9WYT8_ANGAN
MFNILFIIFIGKTVYITTCVNLVMELKLRFYTQIYLCNKNHCFYILDNDPMIAFFLFLY